MPRALTNLEIDDFLQRHPDVSNAVHAIDMGGPDAAPGWTLAYPSAGEAVLDPSGRYVLVWQDASRRWWYIDLADMMQMATIAAATNAPAYVSDPDYLGLIHDAISGVVSGIGTLIDWTPLLAL